MNTVFFIMIVFSFFCCIFTGNESALSDALIGSGTEALALGIKLAGIIAFWSGMMAIGEKSGFTKLLCKCLSPLLKVLFPHLKDDKAKNAIAMNMSANFLGLGSAATPFGLEAVRRIKEIEGITDTASNNLVRFVVINSASVHLVPTSIALLRKEYGSASPLDILLPSLYTSVTAVCFAVLMTFLLQNTVGCEKNGKSHAIHITRCGGEHRYPRRNQRRSRL